MHLQHGVEFKAALYIQESYRFKGLNGVLAKSASGPAKHVQLFAFAS